MKTTTGAAAISVITALSVGGCLKFADHEVFVFGKSMAAIESGQSERPDLHFDSEIPLRYELDRPEYLLLAQLETRQHYPAAFFYAESPDGEDLVVVWDRTPDCYSGVHNISRSEAERRSVPTTAILYIISPHSYECANTAIRPAKVLFDVFDNDGELLGSEEIEFDIVKNGKYLTDNPTINLN